MLKVLNSMWTKRSACMWSAIPPPTTAGALGQLAERLRVTILHPLAAGRAKAWMAGTSPAKTKSAGRFAPLFDRKIFPGQPCARSGRAPIGRPLGGPAPQTELIGRRGTAVFCRKRAGNDIVHSLFTNALR